MDGETPPTQALLSVANARVRFGSLVAVHDVSLQLGPGDLVGLVGPNGAGKTTLLRAIAGLQPIARGTIRILGHDLEDARIQAMRFLGFTADTPPIYDAMTVRTFLRFIGMGYGLDRELSEQRIDFWLERVWLTEKANQQIKSLSRGMKQRLGLARTLLANPVVILLDEPAAGLDPGGRVQFRQLLCSLREQGKALIVSSHILADMGEYCTHIAIMAQGRIMQYGTVAQIAAGATGQRCRYGVTLARPVAGLDRLLAEVPEISGVEIDGQRLMLEYSSEPEHAAALLAQLVALRLPVASFAPRVADIEEAYLRGRKAGGVMSLFIGNSIGWAQYQLRGGLRRIGLTVLLYAAAIGADPDHVAVPHAPRSTRAVPNSPSAG